MQQSFTFREKHFLEKERRNPRIHYVGHPDPDAKPFVLVAVKPHPTNPQRVYVVVECYGARILLMVHIFSTSTRAKMVCHFGEILESYRLFNTIEGFGCKPNSITVLCCDKFIAEKDYDIVRYQVTTTMTLTVSSQTIINEIVRSFKSLGSA